jgi:short-subunit dehydrogenase
MNPCALITGASSGIGKELAIVFAREEYDLFITARRKENLDDLAKKLEGEYGIQVTCLAADLTQPDAPKEVYDTAISKDLNITALVNNAGIGDYGFFHEADWDKTASMIDLNIRSLTHLTRLFLPDLIQKERACIMNVASTAAFQPGPLMSVYYATKHYVLAFSEAIANELDNTGVTVTTLCPGPTKSEFQETAEMQKSKLFDRLPIASSEEVAEYGYRAMIKGKRVAIQGVMNKVSPQILRFLPRRVITWATRKIQERK